MQKIILKKLILNNFCGYAHGEINFNENEITQIKAPSGWGKSTILTAIKTALGCSTSNIYPTIDGYKVARLETSVTLVLDANGYNYELFVESTQKWKTNKITSEEEYVGNNITYTFDGVASTLKDYKEKVALLFGVPFDTIEMLVDIAFFNTDTTKWKWNDRRKFIYQLLDIDKQVKGLIDSGNFDLIKDDILKGKDEVDIQKTLNATKRNLAFELEKNSVLIENANNKLTSLMSIDFDALESRKGVLGKEIEEYTNNRIVSDTDEIRALACDLTKAKTEYDNIERQYWKDDKDFVKRTNTLSASLETKTTEYDKYSRKAKMLADDLEDCEIDMATVSAKAFPEGETRCPTCNRKYSDTKIAELKAKFNEEKEKQIFDIEQKKASIIAEQIGIGATMERIDNEINEIKNKIEENKSTKPTDENLQTQRAYIEELTQKITTLRAELIDNNAKMHLQELMNEYDEVTKQLYQKTLIGNVQNDIRALKSQSRELAQLDARRIETQNQLRDYITAKVNIVNDTVNKNFDGISFKFFDLNGAEAENPFKDDCECIYNGKVYSSCSTGEKIYANVCVHKNIAKLLGVDCFVIVDDYNLCTIPFDIDSQLVELYTTNECNVSATRIDTVYNIEDCIK